MASFRYKAVTESGALTTGLLDVQSRADAVAQIRALGHLPVAAAPASAAPWRTLLARAIPQTARPSARAMAGGDAGTGGAAAGAPRPRPRAGDPGELEETRRLRAPLAAVLASVRDGMSLADAFEATGIFSRAYITMVRAGETGGNLEVTLRALADYLARASAIRETIISALVYPAILLCTAGLSIVFILMFVLPEFAPMFAEAGKALPPSTRIVMAVGAFVTGYWWLIGVLALAGFLLLRRAMKTPVFRHSWDRAVLRLPILGGLVRKMEIERFNRMLGTLLLNGVALPQALLITRDTLGNSVIAGAVGERRHG